MKWKFYVLVMAAVLAGASASAQGSRSIIKQQIDEWGSCRSAALTLTGGDLVLNGFNDYACPDVPENLAVTLSQLRARGDYLDDVQLTEEGRWLILYGDNGVLWNDIPQELEQTLREYNEAQGDHHFGGVQRCGRLDCGLEEPLCRLVAVADPLDCGGNR